MCIRDRSKVNCKNSRRRQVRSPRIRLSHFRRKKHPHLSQSLPLASINRARTARSSLRTSTCSLSKSVTIRKRQIRLSHLTMVTLAVRREMTMMWVKSSWSKSQLPSIATHSKKPAMGRISRLKKVTRKSWKPVLMMKSAALATLRLYEFAEEFSKS